MTCGLCSPYQNEHIGRFLDDFLKQVVKRLKESVWIRS
jgi:hypothetical protein